MTSQEVLDTVSFYFPKALSPSAQFHQTETGQKMVARLMRMPDEPLTRTHLNQLLHLSHEAGISDGFFRYYFLEEPAEHPYPIDRLFQTNPTLHKTGIASLEQLKLGIHRFFVDALPFFSNLRTAYSSLRDLSYEEIIAFFREKRFKTAEMQARGPILPFMEIPADDRYLIAELACKAYTPPQGASITLLEKELVRAYSTCGQSRVPVKTLIALAESANASDLQAQLSFAFSCEEFLNDIIESDTELKAKIHAVAERFKRARERALENTRYYLSIVNELDVYVATSMRNREDFRAMSRNCTTIFRSENLQPFRLRYFDPTNSAADSHEDKGLIECLMVKCAKLLVYFAGEKESFGKDVEAAMALSLGKPIIIYCPSTPEGETRMRFFRDIHPLSRLIDFDTGVAVGAMITSRLDHVVEIIYRVFANELEYDIEHDGDGYFRLLDRLTKSVVRVHTNSRLLQETFWNYYHGIH